MIDDTERPEVQAESACGTSAQPMLLSHKELEPSYTLGDFFDDLRLGSERFH